MVQEATAGEWALRDVLAQPQMCRETECGRESSGRHLGVESGRMLSRTPRRSPELKPLEQWDLSGLACLCVFGELGSSSARERIRVQEWKSSGSIDRGRGGSQGAWLCTSSRLLGSPVHWAMNGVYPHSLEAEHVHAHYGAGGLDKKEPGCGKPRRGQRLTPFSRPRLSPLPAW